MNSGLIDEIDELCFRIAKMNKILMSKQKELALEVEKDKAILEKNSVFDKPECQRCSILSLKKEIGEKDKIISDLNKRLADQCYLRIKENEDNKDIIVKRLLFSKAAKCLDLIYTLLECGGKIQDALNIIDNYRQEVNNFIGGNIDRT